MRVLRTARARVGLIVLTVLAVASLSTAWATYRHGETLRDRITTSAQADNKTQQAHDLGFCTSIGDVWRQTVNDSLNVNLGSYRDLDPSIRPALSREVRSLDEVGDNFPGADYRLVDAARQVADEGAAAMITESGDAYIGAVEGRAAAWSLLAQACGYPDSFQFGASASG